MNRAVVNRFLAHLDPATLPTFQAFYKQNPNMVFGRVFEWFLKRYGQSNSRAPDTIPHEEPSLLLDKDEKKYIQQVVGSFVYYARAIDMTILLTLSNSASK